MRKVYFSLLAFVVLNLLAIPSILAQSTEGPIQITEFADSTNIMAGDNFPDSLMRNQTYNLKGTYGDVGNAVSVQITYDVYKSDWSGTDYSHTWPVANDTIGTLDGSINYDFTIPSDAALKDSFPDGFAIIQVRVFYDPDVNTFWNIFVDVVADTNSSTSNLVLNPIEGAKIFPNPTSQEFLNIFTPLNLAKQVQVMDLAGKVLVREDMQSNGRLYLGKLPAGLYMVRIEEADKISTLKLSVK